MSVYKIGCHRSINKYTVLSLIIFNYGSLNRVNDTTVCATNAHFNN